MFDPSAPNNGSRTSVGRSSTGSTAPRPDLQKADYVCELLHRAAQCNLVMDKRRGAVVELPARGRLVVSGDLHDNRLHFEKVKRVARLDESSEHYLILQEIIHGEQLINGMDFSYRMLCQAAELMLEFPGQVFILPGNHEVAQMQGEGILKDAINVVEAFTDGIDYVFGNDVDRVTDSIDRFIRSMPLAVRCANGVMCSHSLPSFSMRNKFDPSVMDRVPEPEDYERGGGSVHMLIWGRNLKQEYVDQLANRWNARIFVLGHQPIEMGYEPREDTLIIVNSDHNHGVVLPFNLAQTYTRDELIMNVVPLVGVQ